MREATSETAKPTRKPSSETSGHAAESTTSATRFGAAGD
jgi:hypothetical protein